MLVCGEALARPGGVLRARRVRKFGHADLQGAGYPRNAPLCRLQRLRTVESRGVVRTHPVAGKSCCPVSRLNRTLRDAGQAERTDTIPETEFRERSRRAASPASGREASGFIHIAD